MKLYKPPHEKREYFRVTGRGPRPALLLLEGRENPLELRDVSAGGFSFACQEDLAALSHRAGRVLRGQLILSLEVHPLPAMVPVEFSIVRRNAVEHCRITGLTPEGRDLLYTYVFEQDQRRRRANPPSISL